MDTFKAIIYSSCVIGIISTIIGIASPQGSMKKQLDLVLGIVLVMVVITPFMNKDFKIRLSDYTYGYDRKIYGEMQKYQTDTVMNTAKTEVTGYFKKRLNDNGIKYKDIIIFLELNEYNQIEIKKVQVISSMSNKEAIIRLIHEDIPNAEAVVTEGDSS